MGEGRTIDAAAAYLLRNRMRQSGLSVNAIARGCGVPQPTLHRFYVDGKRLTERTATKLTRYFFGGRGGLAMKHSAEVVLNLIDHYQAMKNYLDRELKYMDNPGMKADLKEGYRTMLEPTIEELKDILRRHHPGVLPEGDAADDEDDEE
jgi:plasmid maintenance system antidote protein VapI